MATSSSGGSKRTKADPCLSSAPRWVPCSTRTDEVKSSNGSECHLGRPNSQHTTRAGDFHTDGNVSDIPPLGTAIQCEREDPGAPEYGEQRVAHLPDLLERLTSGDREDKEAFEYLTASVVEMAHERSYKQWRGVLVQNGMIRYHPHSLRVANTRLDKQPATVESVIPIVHRAATDVSVPFQTSPGDTVLVSNRTALHYRGACSVRFTRFPTEFESRSVLVLHLKEPAQ